MVAGDVGTQFRPRRLQIPVQFRFSLFQVGLGFGNLLLAVRQLLLLVPELLLNLLPARVINVSAAVYGMMSPVPWSFTGTGRELLVLNRFGLNGLGLSASGLFLSLDRAQGVDFCGQSIKLALCLS